MPLVAFFNSSSKIKSVVLQMNTSSIASLVNFDSYLICNNITLNYEASGLIQPLFNNKGFLELEFINFQTLSCSNSYFSSLVFENDEESPKPENVMKGYEGGSIMAKNCSFSSIIRGTVEGSLFTGGNFYLEEVDSCIFNNISIRRRIYNPTYFKYSTVEYCKINNCIINNCENYIYKGGIISGLSDSTFSSFSSQNCSFFDCGRFSIDEYIDNSYIIYINNNNNNKYQTLYSK